MEEWRLLPKWDNYEVSSLGRLRKTKSKKIIKGCLDSTGYWATNLSQDGRRRYLRFHVAVLEAFVGPRGDFAGCRHKDGNPKNNRLENLEWSSAQDNSDDQVKHGTRRTGEKQATKLSAAQVLDMRRRAQNGEAVESFAAEYNVSPHYARSVVNGRKWAHLPGAIKRRTNGKVYLLL